MFVFVCDTNIPDVDVPFVQGLYMKNICKYMLGLKVSVGAFNIISANISGTSRPV